MQYLIEPHPGTSKLSTTLHSLSTLIFLTLLRVGSAQLSFFIFQARLSPLSRLYGEHPARFGLEDQYYDALVDPTLPAHLWAPSYLCLSCFVL
jgi:hypothetical protein